MDLTCVSLKADDLWVSISVTVILISKKVFKSFAHLKKMGFWVFFVTELSVFFYIFLDKSSLSVLWFFPWSVIYLFIPWPVSFEEHRLFLWTSNCLPRFVEKTLLTPWNYLCLFVTLSQNYLRYSRSFSFPFKNLESACWFLQGPAGIFVEIVLKLFSPKHLRENWYLNVLSLPVMW